MLGRRMVRANFVAERLVWIYFERYGECLSIKNFPEKSQSKIFGTFRKTRTPCSCWMCGNPRKHGEVTLQEQRDMEYSHDQITDFYNTENTPSPFKDTKEEKRRGEEKEPVYIDCADSFQLHEFVRIAV